MPPYQEQFPVGSRVRILDREPLARFAREWKYHNPLTPAQLEFAGTEGVVSDVAFYHGGDPLYSLAGLPGVWHEQCLVGA